MNNANMVALLRRAAARLAAPLPGAGHCVTDAELAAARAARDAARARMPAPDPAPVEWLALALRTTRSGSGAARVAAALAVIAPRCADCRLADLARPFHLSERETRDALAHLERAGLVKIRATIRAGALELTLATPEPRAGGDFSAPEGA